MVASYQISVEREWCKGCGICIEFCPKEVLGANPDGKVRVLNAEACTGCRWCELRCPDYAIVVGGKTFG